MAEAKIPRSFEVAKVARGPGMNIRVARKRRRMLQGDLARKAGVGEKTIRRLEKGDVGVSTGNVLSVLWSLGLLPTASALAHRETDGLPHCGGRPPMALLADARY